MADTPDPKPAGDPGPQPALSIDDIRKAVGEEVDARLANYTPPDPPAREPDSTPQATVRNPLADVIGPLVDPHFQRLAVEVADAKDSSLFYAENPDALAHKKGIEDAFEALKRQGTPMARIAVYKWYKGNHFEEFYKAQKEAEAEEAERAKAAIDVGPGATRTRQVPAKDPHDMTDDELAAALKGVAW